MVAKTAHHSNARLRLHYGDLSDATNLISIIQEVRPHEIYNLAAQSHVAVSFEAPEYTADVDALGPLRLLEAIRILGVERSCRFYQASTSELYGLVQETPQRDGLPPMKWSAVMFRKTEDQNGSARSGLN